VFVEGVCGLMAYTSLLRKGVSISACPNMRDAYI